MKTIPKNNIGEADLGAQLGVVVRRMAKVRKKYWLSGRLRLAKHWTRRGGRVSYTREGVRMMMLCLGLLPDGETTEVPKGGDTFTETDAQIAVASWTEATYQPVVIEPVATGPVTVTTSSTKPMVLRASERLVVRKITGNPAIILCQNFVGKLVKVRVKNGQLFALGQAIDGFRQAVESAPWQLATPHPRWKGDKLSLSKLAVIHKTKGI